MPDIRIERPHQLGLAAARTVARLALGDPAPKVTNSFYAVPADLSQESYIPGFPLGTRGGLAVDHYFPADGEYEFNIREFFFMGAGYVTKVDHPHRVVMVIDGVRVFDKSGAPIGHISLPERAANLCFGGRHRNRLFMAASHSLYALYVNTQGVAGG